jgi:hypothetical protein
MAPGFGCAGDMETKPHEIIITGSNLEFVGNLTWSGWGTATARGRGVLEINDCRPDCSRGTMISYPATIIATNPTRYFPGQRAYADMVISSPTSPFGTKSYAHLLPEAG